MVEKKASILTYYFTNGGYHDYLKRYLDIVFAIILLIIFSPVFLIVAIAIKLDSPGPIFADVPERVGENGKLFKMYKFRSMIVNAHFLLRNDSEFKKLYEEYKLGSFKLRNDPRITRIGKFIRKHSLDEIPQFLNMLKGDMSLVGPRAYYQDELENQQEKYPETKSLVKEVLSVKPGITGLWQVTGRSDINFDKRVAIDAKYVHNISLLQDLIIILKTPGAMLTGKGAV
ncbi:MAG TPA: sugar transferase [Candidatus Nitrosocosmicus sp.]|nr:sugar transferase [Candidatus Nitrosocosmicus sp.]